MIQRNRSHAQNRTPKAYKANIQKVSIIVGEGKIAGKFCTKCIKKMRKEIADSKKSVEAKKTAPNQK